MSGIPFDFPRGGGGKESRRPGCGNTGQPARNSPSPSSSAFKLPITRSSLSLSRVRGLYFDFVVALEDVR